MKRIIAVFVLLFAGLASGQQPQPIVIPIQNPSFEQGETGWVFGAGSRVVESGGVPFALAGYGSSFSQTLSITPATLQEYKPGYATDGIYTLTFSEVNYFPTYPGYYTIKVTFGTQELCEASGWGTRTVTQVTVSCPSPGYLVIYHSLPSGGQVQGTSPLAVSFIVNDGSPNGGWPILFKDTSLTFTEAP